MWSVPCFSYSLRLVSIFFHLSLAVLAVWTQKGPWVDDLILIIACCRYMYICMLIVVISSPLVICVICRPHYHTIITLVSLMLDTGLPCFRGQTIKQLRDRFQPMATEHDAADYMKRIIKECFLSWRAKSYDWIQFYQQNIPYWTHQTGSSYSLLNTPNWIQFYQQNIPY